MAEEEEEVKLEKEEGFPLSVFYCGVCKLPPEYCEYGSTLKECRTWLKGNNAELFEKFGDAPDVVVEKKEVEEEAEEKEGAIAEDEENKEKKEVKFEEPPKEAANNNKKKGKKEDVPKIKISVSQRNKKKHITTVAGLSSFDIKPNVAAKVFANKYACGASVVKSQGGADVIDIQGDVSKTIVDLITSKWNVISEDSIIFVEEKKKK